MNHPASVTPARIAECASGGKTMNPDRTRLPKPDEPELSRCTAAQETFEPIVGLDMQSNEQLRKMLARGWRLESMQISTAIGDQPRVSVKIVNPQASVYSIPACAGPFTMGPICGRAINHICGQ